MQKLKNIPLLDRVLGLVSKTAGELGVAPNKLVLGIALFVAAVLVLKFI